jgi:hypothetical protein
MRIALPTSRGGESTARARSDFPDFLGIGAPKAGTTWLYEQLLANPGVWLPPKKELTYFSRLRGSRQGLRAKLFGRSRQDRLWRWTVSGRFGDYRRELRRQAGSTPGQRNVFGQVSPATVLWDLRYFLGRPTDEWYASLFRDGRGKVTGEISAGYSRLGHEDVSEIHGLMPDAKIVFLTRHPIERAWSNEVQRTSKKSFHWETTSDWGEYFSGRGAQGKSDYLRTVDVWSTYYPRSQIFVGFFEDIRFHPRGLLRRIESFLGVEPVGGGDVARRVNPGVEETIPVAVAQHLARLYGEEIDALAARWGGHAGWWRFAAERLLEDDAAGAVAYPFYKSSYWREWLAASGLGADELPPLQSNVLSELDSVCGARAPAPSTASGD